MRLNASLVIVPGWVEQAMAASGIKLEAVLDLHALSRILSLSDLSFYDQIQSWLFQDLPISLRQTFESFNLCHNSDKYVMNNADGTRLSPVEHEAFMKKVYCTYSARQPTVKNFLNLLPYMEQHENTSEDLENRYLFEVFHIRDEVFGVRFSLSDVKRSISEQLAECHDSAIKTLLLFNRWEDVALTPMFEQFAKLSRETVATV